MNDEASSSAEPPTGSDGVPAPDESDVAVDESQQLNTLRRRLNKKRGDVLDDLLRWMDVMIHAELAAVYYMDCSFLRLILRVLVQLLYLTPKPAFFPEPPKQRPYIGAIVGTNIVCLGTHLYYPRPEAGEATRGYMHGGLLIDFVGQLGPTSKLQLFLLDVFILALQLAMLAVVIQRQKLRDGGTTPSRRPTTGEASEEGIANQDHDSEERGVHRDDTATPAEANSSEPGTASPEDGPLLEQHDAPPSSKAAVEMLDMLVSGQGTVANLYIIDTVRDQYWAYQQAQPETNLSRRPSLLASVTDGRRLSLRMSLRGG